jgi:hypothetical protein
MDEQGGLGVNCVVQFFFWAFPGKPGDRKTEKVIGHFEYFTGSRVDLGQLFSHADSLGSLAREQECGLLRVHILASLNANGPYVGYGPSKVYFFSSTLTTSRPL